LGIAFAAPRLLPWEDEPAPTAAAASWAPRRQGPSRDPLRRGALPAGGARGHRAGEHRAEVPRPAPALAAARASQPPAVADVAYLEPAGARGDASSGERSAGDGAPAADAARRVDWSGLWAAVRLDDSLRDIQKLGRLVHAHTREPLFEATRRLKHSRGLLGAELPEATARALAAAASALGVPATAVPWPVPPLEEEERVRELAWGEDGIAAQCAGGPTLDLPWRRILVAAGTRFERPAPRPQFDPMIAALRSGDGGWWGSSSDEGIWRGGSRSSDSPAPASPPKVTTRIELLIEPAEEGLAAPAHLCVEDGDCAFLGERRTKFAFREFAQELAARRGLFATNTALDLIIDRGRGRWGYLQFRDRRGHREYLAWLAALARRARLSPGAVAAPASYLE
jgi:hypothetical protein